MITPTPPILICDSREQAPWDPVLVRDGRRYVLPVERRALAVGDYSLSGFESEIAIERKSLDDWVGTMFSSVKLDDGSRAYSWERFLREVGRAKGAARADENAPAHAALKRFVVVVEGSKADVRRHKYKSQTHPSSVLARSLSLWVKHGIHVEWGDTRERANHVAMWMLVEWWEAWWIAAGAEQSAIRAALRTLREAPPARPAKARAPRAPMADPSGPTPAEWSTLGTSKARPLKAGGARCR